MAANYKETIDNNVAQMIKKYSPEKPASHSAQPAAPPAGGQSGSRYRHPRRRFFFCQALEGHIQVASELQNRSVTGGFVVLFGSCGAGDGNRTHVPGLEGRCSTIELHPHASVL